jgi:hypothetical protein
MVGAGIAYWLQSKGLEPGDTLVLLTSGDATKDARRIEGFSRFLAGTLDYTDKLTTETVSTTSTWTEQEITTLIEAHTCACEDSPERAKEYVTTSLPSIVTSASSSGGNLYVVSFDDDMTLGVLDSWATLGANSELSALKVSLASVGGMQELYDAMTGGEVVSQYVDEMMSMSYSPRMIVTAIDYMESYLTMEEWPYAVGGNEFEQTFIVDAQSAHSGTGYAGR